MIVFIGNNTINIQTVSNKCLRIATLPQDAIVPRPSQEDTFRCLNYRHHPHTHTDIGKPFKNSLKTIMRKKTITLEYITVILWLKQSTRILQGGYYQILQEDFNLHFVLSTFILTLDQWLQNMCRNILEPSLCAFIIL